MNKNTTLIIVVTLIILTVAVYTLNKKIKTIELVSGNSTNNYYLDNSTTISIEKVEAKTAFIGDNNSLTTNDEKKIV